jgi:hypothetical protein
MATRADDPDRIQIAFRSIEAMLDELPNLVDDWPTISRDEQLAWSLEWDNEMAKLRRLAEGTAAGRLDRDQQQRFRMLAMRTVRSLALIEQIDLLRPADAVLEAGQVRVSP